MKFSAMLVAAVAAVDTQAPVITLDLDESMKLSKYPAPTRAKPYAKEQDQYGVCQAKAANAVNCKTPTAAAYDHHDGTSISVTETIHLMNVDGQPTNKIERAINYNRRSEYIIKYNAKDAAGNEAEELFFTLILNDITPPVISAPESVVVESRFNGKYVVPAASAVDNIDGSVPVSTSPTSIDTYKLGSTTVTFKAADRAGVFGKGGNGNNVAVKTITVTTKDTQKPWIVMNGKKTMTAECKKSAFGSSYSEAGANCKDARDQTLRATYNTIDTSKVGRNSVVYKCTDYSSNVAVPAVRSVAVVDTKAPVLKITHIGAKHNIRGLYDTDYDMDSANIFKHINDDLVIHHATGYEKDTEYINALAKDGFGYTCTDQCDGKPKVTTQWYKKGANGKYTAAVYDNTEAGTYKLYYKCVDAAGNKASKQRTVVNEDKSTVAEVTVSFEYVVADPAFMDALVKIIQAFGFKDFSKRNLEIVEQRRLVGEAAKKPTLFKIIFKDVSKLKALLAFLKSLDFQKKLVQQCASPVVVASKPSVQTFSKVQPIIYITGGDLETVEASTTTTYSDAGATCSDNQDGIIYTNKAGTGIVKPSVVGEYTKTYTCTDKDLLEATPVDRFVSIVDTTIPVCKLSGSALVTHEASFAYKDTGVVCKDTLDGNVQYTTTGSVDTSKVGTYTLFYNAADRAGNKAKTLSRVVKVVDSLKPVIGLKIGEQPYFHVSDASDLAVTGDKNPAADYFA
jgi:hypothetical protein